MVTIIINGNAIQTDVEGDLLSFLRNDMGLKSVKDGCNEGACGACKVLIDGTAKNSCSQKVEKQDGKSIITVEGLTDREKQVYSYCFTASGAVQCGFCTPGMVISAQGLLDKNLNPTEEEIIKAIRGNICRCTGYKKIVEAIMMCAEYFRENKKIPPQNDASKIGEDVFRIDAQDKVLGTGIYVDDMAFDDMVFASALRSKYPRAVVDDIDISAAKNHPDTVAVILAEDIPGSIKSGHIVKDWDTLIKKGETTRYIGDSLCLVVSSNEKSLDEIKSLIKVSYTPLEPVTSPEDAMQKSAPKLHENGNVLRKDTVKRGRNVEEEFKDSAHVVSHVYTTPFTEHAFMERECAIGRYNDGGVTVFTSSQSIYDEQREICHILGLEKDKVHIISKLVGGAFGGKEDMSVQHHAALAAYVTKRTVKVKLTRQESINVHPKRHAMKIEMTTACDKDGYLTGMKARIVADTGAYASLGGPVVQRACTHAGGPYKYKSVDIIGMAVYTNNPPGGAFRGFGVPQSIFATESNLNLLAKEVGISPWEIRYRNAIEPGQTLPNGQIADDTTALKECLEALKEPYENNKFAGIAGSFKNTGLGVGVMDTGRCRVSVEKGKVHIRTGAARVGQGLDTVMMQIACETLNIPIDKIVMEAPNTQRTPDSGTSTASRQTLFTGQAVTLACGKMKAKLDAGETLESLEGKEYYGEYTCETDPITTTKEHPFSHVAYSYGAQVAILNDKGKVSEVYAAYDVGRVINKKNAEGQVEGGILMGMGYALTEDYILKDGIPQMKYATLGLLRSTDMPKMDVAFVNRQPREELAYGAKGIGEIATIPTAPAVAGAYFAFDGQHRTSLPLENTPYRKQAK